MAGHGFSLFLRDAKKKTKKTESPNVPVLVKLQMKAGMRAENVDSHQPTAVFCLSGS